MNIGFFYGMQTYPPENGGNVHGYQLVRQLIANGHELQSCYFGNHNDPDINDRRGRDLISFLRTVDVIYIRLEWEAISAALSLINPLTLNKIPVIWEINGTPRELFFSGRTQADINRFNRRIKHWARHCSGAIAVADDIADYARNIFGIANVATIPNGSDPEKFFPSKKFEDNSRPLEVVWLGTSNAGWNDLPCLFEAARILEHRSANINIRIFGDKRHLATNALASNIELEGAIPYTELGSRMSTADVGLHLLKIDAAHHFHQGGSPLKLFDYMACGLAAVVNRDGQQTEIIDKYNIGIRCEPTAIGVADALMALERDRKLCAQMGVNGRNAVVETYNWRNTGRATSDFLEAVLARHRQ